MSIKELIPDPEVLIMGLRDTGYEINTALADVIDNSVDADASMINVNILLNRNNRPIVMIADNGCGMTKDELIDGMKYGSSSTLKKDPKRLGKFGLGLKTASTAFCKRLSVISKANPEDSIYMATWDLDNVAKTNAWNLEITDENNINPNYKRTFNEIIGNAGHGTLVIWEKVDRFSSNPQAPVKQKTLDNIVEKFSQYAALIYHRFLDKNDLRAKNIEMKINGTLLEPIDPFCLAEMREDEMGTITTGKPVDKDVEIQREDDTITKSTFHVQGYVLPTKENFSSPKALKKANITNHNMGFYVYRENRMIAAGDWLGTRRTDPHQSLYRAEFSFDHTLDVAFRIDVKKSRIDLAPELLDWLTKWSTPGVDMADNRYRRKTENTVGEATKDFHKTPDKTISGKEASVIESRIKPISDVLSDGTLKIAVTNETNQDSEPCVISIKVAPDEKTGTNVVIDEVRDGALWEPSYRNDHHCVIINPNHPFYQRIYYPNKEDGVTMIGLDSLLWSLAEAEYGTINEQQKHYFEEFRKKVSSIIARLVEDLPEPDVF